VRADAEPGSPPPLNPEFFPGAFDVAIFKADSAYYFKVTHSDGIRPDLTNDPAPYPLFFTGVQAIGNVFVDAGTNRARILWDANVIGLGRVEYGITSPVDAGTVDDQLDVTAHSIEVTGLGERRPGRN
jgi:hypothetical protein